MKRTSLALLLALSLLPTTAAAQVQVRDAAPPPRNVWLTPAGAFLPVEAASLATRVGVAFNYTSNDLLGGVAHSQLQLHGQLALYDRFELGLMIPLISVLAPERGDDQVDLGNLRLDAKVKLWGRSGSPLTLSYFIKIGLPTYSNGDVDRDALGYRVHHGLLVGGEYKGAVYGFSLAPLHWLDISGRDLHLMDIGGYVGYKLHRMIGLQLTFQTVVPLDPSGDAAVVLSPAVRFSPTESMYIDLGGRFALNEEGRINTGSAILPIGGRAQLALGVGYRW
jgi:hypothetical protein